MCQLNSLFSHQCSFAFCEVQATAAAEKEREKKNPLIDQWLLLPYSPTKRDHVVYKSSPIDATDRLMKMHYSVSPIEIKLHIIRNGCSMCKKQKLVLYLTDKRVFVSCVLFCHSGCCFNRSGRMSVRAMNVFVHINPLSNASETQFVQLRADNVKRWNGSIGRLTIRRMTEKYLLLMRSSIPLESSQFDG